MMTHVMAGCPAIPSITNRNFKTFRGSDKLPDKLPLVCREWKNGSNSSYNCAPFLHSLLTKGKIRLCLP